MVKRINIQGYVTKLCYNFANIVKDAKQSCANPYKIAGWAKKENCKSDVLIYQVTATDKYISAFSVSQIYCDDSILLNFSKKEIKYISTLALLLDYKREAKYSIIWESFREQLHNKIVHLKNRENSSIIIASIDELEKNISIIDGMKGSDAYRLGKEAGIIERMREESIINSE